MPTKTEIFLNKYESAEDGFWNHLAEKLEDKGYSVHRETVPADAAIMLNAAFLNPSVFPKKVGFVLDMPDSYHGNEIFWMTHVMIPILKRYYNEGCLVSLYGMTVDQASNKVIEHYRRLCND